MTQQDDITQRGLTEAEKDNIYTAWQDRRDEASYGDLIDDVESAVLSKLRAPVSSIREGFELTYAADADDPACAADLFHFTNGWRACVMSQLRAPVADERAAIAEATAHVTEALMYVDRVAQRKAIGYADFGTNPRRNHSDTRPYNLKDARSDAYTAAILLRKAWDILDPSISFKPAAALASAPVAGEVIYQSRRKGQRAWEDVSEARYRHHGEYQDQMETRVVYAAPQASASDFAKLQSAYVGACDQIAELLAEKQASAENAPVAGKAQQPVACVRVAHKGYAMELSTYVAYALPEGMHDLYAAPQASAEQMQAALQKSFDMGKFYGSLPETDTEDVRNAALEEAAAWVDKRRHDFDHEHGYMEPGTGAWSFGTGAHATAKAEYSAELDEIAEGIRALKQPQADKDGGQWEPQTPEQIAADMRNMARSEGFDWPEPDGGQQRKRYVVLKASGSRYAYVNDTQEGRSINRFDILKGDGWKYAHEFADRMNKEHERAALSAPQAEQGERDA